MSSNHTSSTFKLLKLFTGLAFLVLLLILGGQRIIKPPVPKDSVVVDAYNKNKVALSEVIDFCRRHPELKRIGSDFTWPEDVALLGVAASDVQSVREKMRKAGFPGGVARNQDTFVFLYMTGGLATGGVCKGVIYSPTPPKPIKENLDDMGWHTYAHHCGYRRIEQNWYVFFERS